jgi:hypothetical protein
LRRRFLRLQQSASGEVEVQVVGMGLKRAVYAGWRCSIFVQTLGIVGIWMPCWPVKHRLRGKKQREKDAMAAVAAVPVDLTITLSQTVMVAVAVVVVMIEAAVARVR